MQQNVRFCWTEYLLEQFRKGFVQFIGRLGNKNGHRMSDSIPGEPIVIAMQDYREIFKIDLLVRRTGSEDCFEPHGCNLH